ncbi:MAG: extracellular solute-binding protein [Elusimicrobiota bacterium]|jgi:iron(III) transport system substrate-binding protein|nr:extracellular solute-binding protein [Elusimicrobiota bacterium]
MKKLLALSILLCFGVVILAGCSSKKTDSGKLIIYTPHNEEHTNALVGEFQKDTGIEVEIIAVGIGEAFKRLKSEAQNPIADVAWGGVYSMYMDNLDLFDNYVSANDADLPEAYRNQAGKVTIFCLDGSLLIVNTNLIGDIKIEGYSDLLNPALSGKIIMADPSASGSSFAHLINILYDIGGDVNNQKGWDFVKKFLAINKGKIAGSSGGVPKTVADGEYFLGLSNEDNSINYVRNNAPVKLVYMKEGVSFNTAAMAVVKGAKNLENARKFVDFMTSKKAQEIYGSKTTVRPIRTDVKVGAYMTPLNEIKIIQVDTEYVNAHRQEILDKYKELFAAANK